MPRGDIAGDNNRGRSRSSTHAGVSRWRYSRNSQLRLQTYCQGAVGWFEALKDSEQLPNIDEVKIATGQSPLMVASAVSSICRSLDAALNLVVSSGNGHASQHKGAQVVGSVSLTCLIALEPKALFSFNRLTESC